MQVTFTVPGEPQGKGRHRSTRTGHIYTPKKTAVYENLVKMEYIRQCNHYFGEAPVEVHIKALLAIPSSAPKKRKMEMLLGRLLPTKKPDISNITKAIEDGLNGIAYKDDAQIVDLTVSKRYAETPGVVVTIAEKEV